MLILSDNFPVTEVKKVYVSPIRELMKDEPHEVSSSPSKLEMMQEKYRDIYPPAVPYNKENLDKADALISEKYPFHQNVLERTQGGIIDRDENGKIDITFAIGTSEELQKTITQKVQAYEDLDDKTKSEYSKYVGEINRQYPSSDEPPNAGTRFIDAAVYEGLEKGQSLETAMDKAMEALPHAVPSIFREMEQLLQEEFEKANPEMVKELDGNTNKGIQAYASQTKHDDNYYKNIFAQKVAQYEFYAKNPDAYIKKYTDDPLNRFDKERNKELIENGYNALLYHDLPEARLIQGVFENYNIYDNSLNLNA